MDSSEKTLAKAGPGRALVPTHMPPKEIAAAHERSPTLMAGEVAGAQGQVRIWAPSRRLLLSTIALCSAVLALFLLLSVLLHNLGALSCPMVTLIGILAASIAALRRPCYITTDAAGIGITTRTGSRSIHWTDIHAVKVGTGGRQDCLGKIELHVPEAITLETAGYRRPLRNELLELITERAMLRQHPVQKQLFINLDRLSPESSALLEPANSDIRAELIAGRNIQAIKLYRDRYGLKLSQAKQTVDSLELYLQIRSPEVLIQAQLPDPELRRELELLIRSGREKQARKRYRRRMRQDADRATIVVSLLKTVPVRPAKPEPPDCAAMLRVLWNGCGYSSSDRIG